MLEGLRGIKGTLEAAVGAALFQAPQLSRRQGRRPGQGLAGGQAQAGQGGQRGVAFPLLVSRRAIMRAGEWLPTQRLRRAGNRGRVDAMSIRLATAVNNNNRNNLRANNRARPMRDCALGR
ncbi:hypothetical protein [Stenotrophomonas sp. DDT-1]|uniref:hypothetical protein n=1 Tax=Stenotrophomonas sp. DDT-1 TaxID=1609637 RepID=UPI001F5240DA|nr:hypothetical protein [Stenotrophomonas sp. DDT-1]